MAELKEYHFEIGPMDDSSQCVAIVGIEYSSVSEDEAFYAKEDVMSALAQKDKEIRRLKRSLWLARAERAKAIKWHEGLERYLQARKKWWPSRFSFMRDDEMYHVWYKCWCEVERKCRAKAEEYK